jgi:hypothetical protein
LGISAEILPHNPLKSLGFPKMRGYLSVAWPPFETSFWQLMFHLDPERQAWPRHPLHHIQFTCGAGLPPFSSWRLPFGEAQPERLLEFIAAHLNR